MNRGDIWIINLGGRAGRRPVLVLTRQNIIEYLNKVAVVEITTKGKGYPTEYFIDQRATDAQWKRVDGGGNGGGIQEGKET